MQKYTTQRLGYYTLLMVMDKEVIKTERARFICYNDILFANIKTLEQKQQIIVINEDRTGGIIYGSKEHAHMALKKLQTYTTGYEIKYTDEMVNNDCGYKKIGFTMTKIIQKNDTWNILKDL
ncbi:MAG: hypothetical protein ACRCRT_05345 [Cetobacterium somerae]